MSYEIRILCCGLGTSLICGGLLALIPCLLGDFVVGGMVSISSIVGGIVIIRSCWIRVGRERLPPDVRARSSDRDRRA